MGPQRGSGGRFVKGGGGGGSSGIGKLITKATTAVQQQGSKAAKSIGNALSGGGGRGGGKFVKRTGDWQQVRSLMGGIHGKMSVAIQKAMLAEGQYLRMQMVHGFTSQSPGGMQFAPLSPVTLALRAAGGFAGTKALIRTGTLRGSITVVRESGGVVFVGVHRKSAKAVNIAEVHEFGRTIRITVKMRRFLFAMLRKSGVQLTGAGKASSGFITIPARPFVRPVFETYVKAGKHLAQQRFQWHIAKSLGFRT